MKRSCLFLLATLAVGLLVAPSALAFATSSTAEHSASAPRAPVQPGSDLTYTISGRVLDFAGNPVVGAEVDWGWWTSLTDYTYGGTNLTTSPSGTPADGSFTLGGVLGGHQVLGVPSDDLDVWYDPSQAGLEEMEAFTLDFATNNQGSSYSYLMRPAEVTVTLAHAPAPLVEVRAGDIRVGYARSEMLLTNGVGTASVLPMSDFDNLTAYIYGGSAGYATCPASVEWYGTPIKATGGGLAGAVALDWDNAQRAHLAGPICRHSGKPGTAVKMALSGWPAGEKASFVGFFGPSGSHVYATSLTSQGAGHAYNVPLKIYAKAPVGVYEIGVFRSDNLDSLTHLWDNFQVCTFKASASSISTGHAVRLSGKVPGNGRVTLFASTRKVSAQPSSVSAKGWTKLATYPLKSHAFTTARLRPRRTTYYVARYKGYAFTAFTSVVRVVVH